MKSQDFVKATGRVRVEMNGKLILETKNLVVNAGLDWIAGKMKSSGAPADMSHMAMGTDNTAAAAGNTALGTEVGRVALDSTTVTGSTIEYVATFPPGTATGALTEAAILNAGTGGTMLARTVFGVITKGALDGMVYTWTITLA